MACSKNVRLIRWYFHLIPLNSFRQCSLITAHVFQLSYRQGPSFPVRHSSQTVLTAVLWPRCQLLLSCGVAFDMFLERYQKFGGLTLGRKPTKKHATKETKHTTNPSPPWKWNQIVSVILIRFTSLNFRQRLLTSLYLQKLLSFKVAWRQLEIWPANES